MAKPSKLLNQYEAAVLLGMSPTLLKWFTGHAAKSGDPRKLKIAKKDGSLIYFEKQELLDFDAWLRQPWPHPPGTRPYLPSAIRREIRIEAGGTCAICHTHPDTCEAAHLEEVSVTRRNHPHDLLWLCANHHTRYDNGSFGPDEANEEFVIHFKKVLQKYAQIQWETQAKASRRLFDIVDVCAKIMEELQNAQSKEQTAAVEKVATGAIAALATSAPTSKSDDAYEPYTALSKALETLSKKKSTGLKQKLQTIDDFKADFRRAAGLVDCPLCKGDGRYHQDECPVCEGSGAVEQDWKNLDLSPYEYVKCPLCKGAGQHRNEECPVCHGEREMQRGHADRVDTGDFKTVDCPLCKGSGRHEGEACPACGGEGQMQRNQADRIDLGDYRKVDCRLCKGSGRYRQDDCPECGGDGKIDRRYAEQIDMSKYKEVTCPLCNGKATFRGETCPACDGEGKLESRFADTIYKNDYI
jgi:hypothetical protein